MAKVKVNACYQNKDPFYVEVPGTEIEWAQKIYRIKYGGTNDMVQVGNAWVSTINVMKNGVKIGTVDRVTQKYVALCDGCAPTKTKDEICVDCASSVIETVKVTTETPTVVVAPPTASNPIPTSTEIATKAETHEDVKVTVKKLTWLQKFFRKLGLKW